MTIEDILLMHLLDARVQNNIQEEGREAEGV
jgi:hypothetical protein